MKRLVLCSLLVGCLASIARAFEPVPEKLVVLSFDDSVKSHYTVVRPILLRHGFGATFFITEGFDIPTNKTDYMTWEEIAQLHEDGFEIGNHTRDHAAVKPERLATLPEQLEAIARRCQEHGIPRPTSFAYPGNSMDARAFPLLAAHGIRFARRGGAPEFPYELGRGFAYEPGLDHPLLIPSAGDARPDWELEDFIRAVQQARHGRIAVLQFHGVPDNAHPWVHTPVDKFEAYMDYLASNGYRVIAMRDLAKYVDPQIAPLDWQGIIEDRKRALATGTSRENFRTPADDDDLRRWLENMAVYHRFATGEMCAATGLPPERIEEALAFCGFCDRPFPTRKPDDPLTVLPYPGGRHPRIGFRDGAVRPQRDTKISVFAPDGDGSYVVVDLPEAIWWDRTDGRELLYLAHTHFPHETASSRLGIRLEPLEWTRAPGGALEVSRTLPNDVSFGARVVPERDAVRMELWLTNGTDETLTGLVVQNCVMFRGAPAFAVRSNENKHFAAPYAACRSADGRRWVITAWERCARVWGNPHCPCMHSDPQFADCLPGETQQIRGWLSFYEGQGIAAEIERIDALGWRE